MFKGGLTATLGVLALCSCEQQQSQTAEPQASASEPTGWVYTQHEDKMRRTITHQACIRAKPNADQPRAKSSVRSAICLQDQPGTGDLSLFIRVTDDQLRCEAAMNCTVYWKVADGEVMAYPSIPWDDRSGSTIYVGTAVPEVQSGNPIMVELPLYDSGATQFTFHTAGLSFTPNRTSP